MAKDALRYWLRPRIDLDGDVRWGIVEATARPTPECLGPYENVAEAAQAAEPDRLAVSRFEPS